MNKKLSFFLFCAAILVLSAAADNNKPNPNLNNNKRASVLDVYQSIDFGDFDVLNPGVFAMAFKGFYTLQNAGLLSKSKSILTVCDYSLSSIQKRFWVIDLESKRVLYNTLMAHGQGSGEEYARSFSDVEHSHQSSLGFFITGATYMGRHGLSLYLHGVDEGFNQSAFKRSVVMHGADYVSRQFIAQHKRLGRSWGCPAIPNELVLELVHLLKDSVCFFAYYPSNAYLSSSKWLKEQGQWLADVPSGSQATELSVDKAQQQGELFR